VFKNYGVDDPSAVDDEMTLRKRISDLEKELKAAQEERKSNKAKGSLSEDTKMISELSQMNARLRNKVNELTEELSRLKSS
jgi:uncharacterized coiled-coil DUF342 family protein